MKLLNKRSIRALLIFLYIIPLQAQTDLKTQANPLLLDESIKSGVLSNGLTYFIKPLKEPQPKITMNFLVKVGSFNEKQNQINFAHHIEHLAFRETDNFPKGLKGNSKLLSQLNMHSGSLNANTGINATKYFFRVPVANQEALDTGLLWFKDIAASLDLSKENIDRERGVLLQENRDGEASKVRQAAISKLHFELFPCFNSYLNFTKHNKSFPFQDLQQFYHNWYRPDRMAVVIIGNIDNVDDLEHKIRNMFEDLKPPNNEMILNNSDQNNSNTEKDYVSIERSSTPNSKYSFNPLEIYLFYRNKITAKKSKGLEKIKKQIQGELVTEILNRRFKETNGNNKASYYSTYTPHTGNPPNMLTIITTTELAQEEASVGNTIHFLNQLSTYGITEEELKIAKNRILNSLQPSNIEGTAYWLREIDKYFVNIEALPDDKNKSIRDWLLKLSREEINKTIREIITPLPNKIGIIYPANSNTILISEEKMRKLIKEQFTKLVSPYEAPKQITKLLSDKDIAALPVEKNIKSERGGLDSKKYVLKNGLKLILKPIRSSGENSRITMHGFSPHGANCFPEEEYYSTMFAPSIIKNSGIGEFSKLNLQNFYRNTSSLKLGFSPYINYKEVGMEAEVSGEELEKLLQLVYLYFKEPREDRMAFENLKLEYIQDAPHFINPANDLIDALNEVTRNYSRLPSASRLVKASQRVNFDQAYLNYKTLFSMPGSFTFILAGDFDENEVLPLLQKYLGNIPSDSKFSCSKKNEEVNLPKGPKYFELETSELYKTENAFYGLKFVRKRTEKDNWKEELGVISLGMVMDGLIYGLRSDEGFSLYQFGAGGNYNRIMDRYEIQFRFNCLPEQLPVIRKKIHHIINNLKSGNVSKDVFDSQMNILKSVYNSSALKQPSYVAKKLYRYYRYEEPLISASTIEEFFKSLTFEDIIEIARKYFKDEYLYEVKVGKQRPEN